jgi:endonuclease/exonuclease/phosphatase (EEP) superfamily protein YafD
LLTHFPELACVSSLIAVLLLARRSRVLALLFAALFAYQVYAICHLFGPNPVPPDPRSPSRLRILAANVLHTNASSEALVRWIRDERPDVIGLVEFSSSWQRALAAAHLEDEYPYRYECPHEAEGLALYFRQRPLWIGQLEQPVPGANPVLPATLTLEGRPLSLWLVHPASPIARHGRARGRGEAMALARRVGQSPTPRVVVGDLNRTDGSPIFSDFLRVAGLRDSRRGFGGQPTWPAWSPYRIAIDHALVSPELAVVKRFVGPNIGSDHLPFLVELAPAVGASVRNASTQHDQSAP